MATRHIQQKQMARLPMAQEEDALEAEVEEDPELVVEAPREVEVDMLLQSSLS
jgi:hypothetical protein